MPDINWEHSDDNRPAWSEDGTEDYPVTLRVG